MALRPIAIENGAHSAAPTWTGGTSSILLLFSILQGVQRMQRRGGVGRRGRGRGAGAAGRQPQLAAQQHTAQQDVRSAAGSALTVLVQCVAVRMDGSTSRCRPPEALPGTWARLVTRPHAHLRVGGGRRLAPTRASAARRKLAPLAVRRQPGEATPVATGSSATTLAANSGLGAVVIITAHAAAVRTAARDVLGSCRNNDSEAAAAAAAAAAALLSVQLGTAPRPPHAAAAALLTWWRCTAAVVAGADCSS